MAEIITLTTPEPGAQNYTVTMLKLDWANAHIFIHLRGDNGAVKTHAYSGATATALMIALNKANLTLKSLQRRVIERLQLDGVISGSISGTPD
jgi:hypothetical protein